MTRRPPFPTRAGARSRLRPRSGAALAGRPKSDSAEAPALGRVSRRLVRRLRPRWA